MEASYWALGPTPLQVELDVMTTSNQKCYVFSQAPLYIKPGTTEVIFIAC
jgi:hypothetical protein